MNNVWMANSNGGPSSSTELKMIDGARDDAERESEIYRDPEREGGRETQSCGERLRKIEQIGRAHV